MENLFRIIFFFGIGTAYADPQFIFEEQSKQLKNYKNPKDVGLRDFFKLGSLWFNSTSDVLQGLHMLDSVEKPMVSIFGGHALDKKNPNYKKAAHIAKKLAEAGIAIITGGGAGVMEAANCAAASVKGQGITSIAVGIRGLETNACAQKRLELDYFFPRKWLLMEYSSAFIILPGGMGTIDELAQLVTLISKQQMQRVPIYVVGQEYWKNFKKWLQQDAVRGGLISKNVVDLITFTDDADRIVREIIDWIARHQPEANEPEIKKNLMATEIIGI